MCKFGTGNRYTSPKEFFDIIMHQLIHIETVMLTNKDPEIVKMHTHIMAQLASLRLTLPSNSTSIKAE